VKFPTITASCVFHGFVPLKKFQFERIKKTE
jgi:hypothetical protein